MAIPTTAQLLSRMSKSNPSARGPNDEFIAQFRDFSTQSELLTSGFFNGASALLSVGDIITAIGSDGTSILEITQLSPSVTTAKISTGGGSPGGPEFAFMFLSVPFTTVITTPNVFTKVLGLTVSGGAKNFTVLSNNLITYNGPASKNFDFHVSASLAATMAADTLSLGIFIQSAVIGSSEQIDFFNAPAIVQSTSLTFNTVLFPGQIIELHIKNITQAANIDVQKFSFIISEA